jgi:4-amino-4-deoxy-L-arabinose transferase-like glycosyltransferase
LRTLFFSLVLLLSAWVQINVVARTSVESPIQADTVHYVSYAWNLRAHHVFSRAPTWATGDTASPMPDKMTLPGYPAFLSMLLDGPPDMRFIRRAVFAQAALGVATCAFVLLAALRLLPFGWAVATGVLTAISPHLATISTYLLTEALYTTLVAASIYVLVRTAEDNSRARWYAAAGLVLGLASLVRPQLQLVPFVLLAACLCVRGLRPRLRPAILGLMCFLAVVMPWQLRNAGIERNQADPDLLAATLYNGAFPDMMYQGDPASYGFPYRYDPDKALHGSDVPAAVAFISQQFGKAPLQMSRWYLIGKPRLFLSWNIIVGMGDVFIYPVSNSPYLQSPLFRAMRALVSWLHWPLMIAALCALVAAWRPIAIVPEHRRVVRMLALVFAVVLLMHIIGTPLPRYGIPFRPLVYLLGMAMLHGIWQWLRPRSAARTGAEPSPRSGLKFNAP